ncbi:phage head morphogenesis protein [Enterobacteriaceae bacterium LUAb1]
MSRSSKSRTLRPVNYNAGNIAWYRNELLSLIREMSADVKTEIIGILRKNTLLMDSSRLAMDISPVNMLRNALRSLSKKWIGRFVKMAVPVAENITSKTSEAVDRSILSAARKNAVTLNMQWTDAMKESRDAIIAENVALIRSIPEKYFTDVESMVFRSVAKGGDRKALADEIEISFGKRYGITRRRAEFIAKDQVRKATSSLSAVRQQEAGITEGEWVHSGGGNKPRQSHVGAGKERKRFRLSEGCLIDGEYIMPGQLINCGCTWKPVIPF